MAEPEPLRTSRKKNLAAVVRDSLLQGMENSIYQSDLSSKEVCCLLEVSHSRHCEEATKAYQPCWLQFHTALPGRQKCYCERRPRMYQAWLQCKGDRIEGHGAQVVFSLTPLVMGKGVRRTWWILWVNFWLYRSHQEQRFGFCDHRTLFENSHLLRRHGIHLTKQSKSIFANRLANIVRRTLN